MGEKRKRLGQVFTPEWVVDLILDKVDYKGTSILDTYVLEPGCGNGNFLVALIERYITSAREMKYPDSKIIQGLETYIYGIEIDSEAYLQCLDRVNTLAKSYNLTGIKWNIFNADILDATRETLPPFDLVVGNPPYVRIHNLDKKRLSEIKSRFQFCKNGIIDLFLVFFEIGITLLKKEGGKLGFITPNSFIHNSTYTPFRKYLVSHKVVREIINFKEYVIFEDASTYNAITILDTDHKSNEIKYYEYADNKITHIRSINLEAQDLKKWNFTNLEDALFLEEIKNRKHKISDIAVVQYGFATLLDEAYIIKADTLFSFPTEECDVIYPVVKASRYDGGKITDKIIYPYICNNHKWIPISEELFKSTHPNVYAHLYANSVALKNRSCDKRAVTWYEYGRSQGIQTIHNEKLVISPIFKEKMKVFITKKRTMVYSGMFLFIKETSPYSLDEIKKIIEGDDFVRYARLLGKDMRGGYKNINTKAIKEYAFD